MGFTYVAISVGAFLMALPFLWTISISLRPPGGSATLPIQWLPMHVTLSEYAKVFADGMGRFTGNSVVIAALSALFTMITGSLCGYAWAVFRFPGRHLMFTALLLLMALPQQVMIVPVYLIWSQFSAIDTYVPLIAPYLLGITSAFGIFLIRQTFLGIPRDFYEAAQLDGAGPLRILTSIYVPLGLPGVVTAGLLAFIASWNEVFGPLIYLNTQSKYTVQLGLLLIQSAALGAAPPAELLAAAAIVTMIPIIIVFVTAQRWIVRGFVGTGLKG